jgi:hypothetical protein
MSDPRSMARPESCTETALSRIGIRPRRNASAWARNLLALALVATWSGAGAHDDAYLDTLVGPNGGQMRIAGAQHLELVIDPPEGAAASAQPVSVFLTDHADQGIDSSGFSGRAAVVANRERVDIALTPAGDNQLAGEGVVAHDPDMVVIVSLILPDGTTEQARFTPYRHLDGSPRGIATADATAADAASHQHH